MPALAALAVWSGLAALAPASAGAQPVTIPRFDFSFANPGARSLGFGGAFAALADDATAAYANPAGLVQLTAPEVSLEARLQNRSPAFLAGGRADGTPTGIGLDTREGVAFGRDSSRTLGPYFASVVIPRGRWSFALYGHQLARFEEAVEAQGFFFDDDGATGRFPGTRERVDLEVRTAGAAAGWRLDDRWSFGLGIVYAETSLRTRSDAFLPDDESEASFFGPISFLPERRLSGSQVAIDGGDLTLSAGALWRPTEQLSAGLFYRQGARAEGTAAFETGPAASFQGSSRNPAELAVPDVAGAGLAYRSPGGALTLAGEIDHVGYAGLVQVQSTEDSVVFGREYDDAWEYHAGAEYALLRSNPIVAFRAGYWIEANGDDLTGLAGREVHHWSAGLGIAAPIVQIDLAGDFSEAGDTASLSLIYSF
jgi:long-chain fatty acid transport protein